MSFGKFKKDVDGKKEYPTRTPAPFSLSDTPSTSSNSTPATGKSATSSVSSAPSESANKAESAHKVQSSPQVVDRKDVNPRSDAVPTIHVPSSGEGLKLGKECNLIGKFFLKGVSAINGRIEGEIVSEGAVTIGECGVINGTINAVDIVALGTIYGDLKASKSLTLKSPAQIFGDISAPSLVIEEGVLFEGKCIMSSSKHQKLAEGSPNSPRHALEGSSNESISVGKEQIDVPVEISSKASSAVGE